MQATFNGQPLIGLPKGYNLVRRNDDGAYFVAPKAKTPHAVMENVVLTPVQVGYRASGRLYSTELVPACGAARSFDVIV
jgi:hypothetical protein